jgi:hypothetical protein
MAADAPPRPTDETANPHRAAPAPRPEEGLRPEADPAVVRPVEEERLGPAEGLVRHAAAEAAHEAPIPTPEADAETAYLGVEEEGVESAQIFGLMLATVVAVACIILAIYFIFYLPRLNETEAAAEDVPATRRVELRELRADAENLIGQYAVNPDAEGRYRIPIAAAMQQTAARYGGRAGAAPLPYTDRADFNLAWATLEPPPAVATAAVPGSGAVEEAVAPAPPAAEGAAATPPPQTPPPAGE